MTLPSDQPRNANSGTQRLALLGASLTMIGVILLITNGHLGTLPFIAGITAIAAALIVIGWAIWRECRQGNSPFQLHLTSRPQSQLFDGLVIHKLPPEGIALIGVDAASVKIMRRWLWTNSLLLIPLLVSLPLMLYEPAGNHKALNAVAIHRLYVLLWAINAAILAGVLAYITQVIRRKMRMRIGTDGVRLLFDDGGGAVCYFDWNEVFTNRRSLLIGRNRIPIYINRTWPSPTVFPSEFLREYVLARLPVSSYVGDVRLMWITLTRSSLSTRLVYGSIALMFGAGQYLKYHQDLTEPLRVALLAWLTH